MGGAGQRTADARSGLLGAGFGGDVVLMAVSVGFPKEVEPLGGEHVRAEVRQQRELESGSGRSALPAGQRLISARASSARR